MGDRSKDAYLRGRRDFRQGVPSTANPYGDGDDLALFWDVGWQDAQTLDELYQMIQSQSRKVV